MDSETALDAAPSLRSRWLRGWRLGVLVSVGVVVVLGVGFGLVLRSAAQGIQDDASAAQASIEATKAHLEAGDFTAASASAALAETQVAAAADGAQSWPVRTVARIPVLSTAASDLDNLIGAATDLAHTTSRIVVVYGAATGKAPGQKLFAGGRVNFGVLERTTTAVTEALAEIDHAKGQLQDVQGTIPGTWSMGAARDKALAQIAPLEDTLTTMRSVLERMPDALGRHETKTYLLVALNPAELYPGGGAALNAALVRFTDGVLSVPLKGTVSTKIFPNNPRVVWDHVVNAPYFAPGAGALFSFSDLHPDFTVTGVEMQRSWVANGKAPVDGVIALDPAAISAALRVSGPVTSPVYGQITADNLVQKLLVDGYTDFGIQGVERRHQLNEALMNTIFSRLKAGSGAISMLRAIASTAPSHHLRIFINDPALQQSVAHAGLDGGFPAPGGDLLAVFSENQNGSKVDIFQKRTVTRDVTLAADGSATVTTKISAFYDVPTAGRQSTDRRGYLTSWAENWYLAYLPAGATLVSYTAPTTDADDHDDPVVYPDRNGLSVMRLRRWTPAGGTTDLTMVYTFPAGTFSTPDGVDYRLSTMPQPLTQPATMTVTVTGPGDASIVGDPGAWTTSGAVARVTGPFSEVTSTHIQWR